MFPHYLSPTLERVVNNQKSTKSVFAQVSKLSIVHPLRCLTSSQVLFDSWNDDLKTWFKTTSHKSSKSLLQVTFPGV